MKSGTTVKPIQTDQPLDLMTLILLESLKSIVKKNNGELTVSFNENERYDNELKYSFKKNDNGKVTVEFKIQKV